MKSFREAIIDKNKTNKWEITHVEDNLYKIKTNKWKIINVKENLYKIYTDVDGKL